MKQQQKKPPNRVLSIGGGPVSADVVTQKELRAQGDLQAAEYLASQAMQRGALEILLRVKNGAVVQGGTWEFDRVLNMARHKRRKEGSG